MQEHEHEELVPYLGRNIPKRGFRVYIFASEGRKKLVESYDEFDLFIHSNEWFATPEEVKEPVKETIEVSKKPRKKTEE